MSGDIPDPSQDQMATLFTNGSVTYSVRGQNARLNIEAEQLNITKAQAEMLVEALSMADFETYVEAETARRTQETLRERFGLDETDESFFE